VGRLVRVAVVDVGTNSTRLLVADVTPDGAISEIERLTQVTRLGEGVDANGRLGEEPMARVLTTLDRYAARIGELGAETTVGVLTSAVRDAANGEELTAAVRERGIDARVITGEEEAALTFAGATSERTGGEEELVVIDIGGGSTELVTGHGDDVDFHVSMQAGVVRLGERHLHGDPPTATELEALLEDFRATLAGAVPPDVARRVQAAVAVAGTPTSAAAIDLELEPYDRSRTHGHVLSLDTLDDQLARLAAMPLEERRGVRGLHPDRAPTIVAGIAMLGECLRAFGLDRVEVSEHDILRGAALAATRR
jgi:exopolyphosphatase / guanosine-5'-triphosphate,3'-diphosphate pyrophosphatase